MKPAFIRQIGILATVSMPGLASPVMATDSTSEAQSHDHHDHGQRRAPDPDL